MPSSITTYRTLTRDFDRALQTRAGDGFTTRETAYFRDTISKVKSVEAFVANKRLMSYAMKAHGLGDMTYATAFVRKVLTEGIDKDDALANRLADPRFRAFVKAFNFARHGPLATTFESAQSETIEKYGRVKLEEEVGATSPGVRLALYFERQAGTVTTSLSLLADPALARFARTVAGLPEAVAMLDIDRQAELLGRKIDVARLKEPEYLRRLVTNFLARWDSTEGAGVPAAASLVAGGVSTAGFGIDVLMSLQVSRSGGRS